MLYKKSKLIWKIYKNHSLLEKLINDLENDWEKNKWSIFINSIIDENKNKIKNILNILENEENVLKNIWHNIITNFYSIYLKNNKEHTFYVNYTTQKIRFEDELNKIKKIRVDSQQRINKIIRNLSTK